MADAERAWQVIRQHHAAIAHDNAEVPGGQVGMTCAHTESGPGFTERMLAAGEGCLLLEATGPGVFERFVHPAAARGLLIEPAVPPAPGPT